MRRLHYLSIGLIAILNFSSCSEEHPDSNFRSQAQLDTPRLASGKLTISLFGDVGEENGTPKSLHRTIWVNNARYHGMEDTNLRGFLDGRFKWGWNQAKLIYTSLGRRPVAPRYGEHELFRFLQRWDDLSLPPGVRVRAVGLRLTPAATPDHCMQVMVYEVKKDWDPGIGGIRRDNHSPPNPGEVWWNDRSFPDLPWSLPGLGLASDTDPAADTGAMPLAVSELCPSSKHVTFSSESLSVYAQRRFEMSLPLLFLFKLDDASEDLSNSLIPFYSANHGANRNVSRRPQLAISWESSHELASSSYPIVLERGRMLEIDRPHARDAVYLAASFEATDGADSIVVEVKRDANRWQVLEHPEPFSGGPLSLRVIAATDLVPMGQAFEDELSNAWIRTAAPEDQRVEWRFESPSGRIQRTFAQYAGDYRWTISFIPDEVGAWTYSWTESFLETPHESEIGVFTVVALEDGPILDALQALAEEITTNTEPHNDHDVTGYMRRLVMLERAGMKIQTSSSWRGERGAALREKINSVRAALGQAAPSEIPLEPGDFPPWAPQAR